jgi:hypothetical protein
VGSELVLQAYAFIVAQFWEWLGRTPQLVAVPKHSYYYYSKCPLCVLWHCALRSRSHQLCF